MILLLDLMGLAAGEREGMGEEAFRGNCKIMVVHYVTMTKGESQKIMPMGKTNSTGMTRVLFGHQV